MEGEAMNENVMAQQLHDRATRGELLSAEEQARLHQWYEQQDQEETRLLAPAKEPPVLTALRDQIDASAVRLSAVAEQIQTLNAETESLRREIIALERQLAQRAMA
jgi:hypothetical protein